jgi:hypothetical protein
MLLVPLAECGWIFGTEEKASYAYDSLLHNARLTRSIECSWADVNSWGD